MPHIKKEQRLLFKEITQAIDSNQFILEKGDLEYLIYYLMGAYMSKKEVRYSTLHDAVYAAVHAAHEFERNHLDKRENRAMKENSEAYYGDKK